MKRAIITTAAMTIAMMTTSAMAQSPQVTSVSLNATVADAINLGPMTLRSTNGATITGSGNTFEGTVAIDGNAVTGHQNLTIEWSSATISTTHKLTLTSQNGGLHNPVSLPPQSTAQTKIFYVANLWWDANIGAQLNLVDSPEILTKDWINVPRHNSLFQLTVDVYPISGLASGTYSDTLTATITPNM